MDFRRSRLLARAVLVAAGLALLHTSAAADAFVKGPYLNKVSASSAQIIVDIGAPSPGEAGESSKVRVKYGLNGSLDRVAEAQRGSPLMEGQFIARLSDLRPGSEYSYQVHAPGGVLSKTYRFATAPGKPRPFSFMVFADTQKIGREHASVVAAAAKHISEAPAKPSFLIHLGDHVRQGTDEKQWNKYFANSRPLLAELCEWPVAGNHDYKDGKQLFLAMYDLKDSAQYSFRHAGATFVIVDTNGYDQEKQEWLVRTLESIPSGEGPIVVAMHDSLYSSGGRKPGNTRIRQMTQPVFERTGVDVVLSGHEHLYERTKPVNGVTYIVAGSAGAPARKLAEGDKGSDFTAHVASVENFMVFTVDGRKMSGKAISALGEVFDALPEFDWGANDPAPGAR